MAYDVAQAYVQILPSAEKFGSTLKSDLGDSTTEAGREAGSKFASGLSTGLKAAGAALAAASTGLVALSKEVIGAYGSYEQLVGGVQKLFGDMDYQSVIDNASKAFETAGISANDYMETVTSFSASLISSLDGDTQKAVEYADMAIRDMSDNANTFGTDIESIQNAYQGFAKQNYTMLDNLKLGYGGTKTEMERLITDAEKLDSTFQATRDTNGNLALSYSDVIDAIHIVQDNMNITGTTAREASSTIEGSIQTMKAAWENLLTGMGDSNADIEQLTQNFIDSFENVITNIEPVIKNLADVLPDVLESVLDVAADILPDLIVDLLPAAVSGLTKLAAGLITHIPQIIGGIAEGLIDGIAEVITGEKTGWFDVSEEFAAMFDDLSDRVSNLRSELDNTHNSFVNASEDAEANAAAAKTLKDRIFELVGQEEKTAEQKQIIAGLVEQLNGLIPGLNLQYDAEKDSLNLTNNEIDRNIQLMEQQAKMSAAQDFYTEALKNQYQAQKDAADAQDALNEVLSKYNLSLQDISSLYQAKDNPIEFTKALYEATDGFQVSAEEVMKFFQDFPEVAESYGNANKNLADAVSDVQWAEELLGTTTTELATTTATQVPSIADQYSQTFGTTIPEELQGAITAATDAGYQIPNGLITGLSTQDISLDNAVRRMNALVQFNEAISNANVGGAEVGQGFINAWLSGEFELNEAQAYWTSMIEFSEAVENAKAGGEEVTAEFINGLLADYGLQGVVSAAEEIGKSAKPTIVPNEIHEVGASVAQETAAGMSENEYQVQDAAQSLVDTVTETTSVLPGEMNATGDESGSNLESAYSSWQGAISGAVDETYNFFYDTLGSTLTAKMYDWGYEAGTKYRNALDDRYDAITGVASDIASGIETEFDPLPGWLESAGYDGGAGLYNGFQQWESPLYSLASSIAWNISSTIRAAFNSHSPSRVTMAIGEDVGEGLAIGIEHGGDLAITAAEDVSYDIIDATSHYDYGQIESVQAANDDRLDQIVDLLDELRNLRVVMDSGEVVGVLAPELDNELERRRVRQGRG